MFRVDMWRVVFLYRKKTLSITQPRYQYVTSLQDWYWGPCNIRPPDRHRPTILVFEKDTVITMTLLSPTFWFPSYVQSETLVKVVSKVLIRKFLYSRSFTGVCKEECISTPSPISCPVEQCVEEVFPPSTILLVSYKCSVQAFWKKNF